MDEEVTSATVFCKAMYNERKREKTHSMSNSIDPQVIGQEQIRVSVIIVNWNTCDLLHNCVRSVKAQTSAVHEIIVIDNASSDGSAEMVRREFPDVILIANTGNRGFAAANNQGLEIARGESVLLLNPDTVVLDHAIDTMLDWLEIHRDVGCVGCQVLEGPDVVQKTCFADPSPLNLAIIELGLLRLARYARVLGRPWYMDWDRESTRDVDVVSGMFMLVPRMVLQEVGPLDEGFFVYAEEADWCRRIRKVGWRCVFATEAQIIHLDGGSKSTAQIRSRMYVQLQKSHLYYVRKHYGRLGFAAVKTLFVGSALARGVLFGIRSVFRRDADTRARVRLSAAALRYHLFGREAES
ncbi:glycosyltransferase family 2 protein [Marimonas arenosa]|uniref:Glycosyltransferase family 2 protein n=1 Tax=Marimonas arenosa TaxID=1795305 RepID=A0AAE3WBN1_9RHOB|nr:glycosyltransferase family 2 protein [Marimonas arenosa]